MHPLDREEVRNALAAFHDLITLVSTEPAREITDLKSFDGVSRRLIVLRGEAHEVPELGEGELQARDRHRQDRPVILRGVDGFSGESDEEVPVAGMRDDAGSRCGLRCIAGALQNMPVVHLSRTAEFPSKTLHRRGFSRDRFTNVKRDLAVTQDVVTGRPVDRPETLDQALCRGHLLAGIIPGPFINLFDPYGDVGPLDTARVAGGFVR